jgi:thiol:disulfide interchange protein DsbA
MNRRGFITAMGAAFLAPAAFAAGPERDELVGDLPIMRVGPFPEHKKSVFEFFMFPCPFCQQHFVGITGWGRTLPKQIRFETVPVIIDRSTFDSARAYYAAEVALPGAGYKFAVAGLQFASEGRAITYDEEIARLAGVQADAYRKAWFAEETKKRLTAAMIKTVQFKVENTPSLGIAGKYLLHADQFNGDYSLMVKMANGLISRIIEG